MRNHSSSAFFVPNFASSETEKSAPVVLFAMLIQIPKTESLNLVTQSETKSLEDNNVYAHKILRCYAPLVRPHQTRRGVRYRGYAGTADVG